MRYSGKSHKVVSVEDSGSGIDSDIMPRLFDKFASKSYQGTGLGLFISKKIIEAHGVKFGLRTIEIKKEETAIPVMVANIKKINEH